MILAAATALLLASPGCDLPELVAERPFASGETLTYEVSGAGGGGSVTLALLDASDGTLPMTVEATSRSALGRASFRARSLVGEGSLRPIRFHDEQSGAGGPSSTDAHIARSANAVRVDWTVGGRRGMNAYRRSLGVLDLASALPYLRAAALQPGQAFCFDAVGATRYWHVEGRVGAVERVVTPAGRFEALRLDARLVRAGTPALRVPATVWISTDAARLPVAVSLDSPLGKVRAELSRVAAGR